MSILPLSDLSTVGATDTITVNSYTSFFNKIKIVTIPMTIMVYQKPSTYYLGVIIVLISVLQRQDLYHNSGWQKSGQRIILLSIQ